MDVLTPPPWNEFTVGRAIFEQAFTRKHVALIRNTYYTGYEADVLIVRNDLRLMDIEIKVSRSDFKADQHKDKWWKYGPYADTGEKNKYGYPIQRQTKTPREWPVKIWKHYYCLPQEVWKDDLAAEVSPKSGIMLLSHDQYGRVALSIHRQAKPNKDAKPISANEAIEVARLCNARMWGAFGAVDRMRQDCAQERLCYTESSERQRLDQHPEAITPAGGARTCMDA